MSYTIDLIVAPLPTDTKEAWTQVQTLRTVHRGDKRAKAQALLALHEALTTRYPCLCSYADDDPDIDQCPWADGPMINNFAHEMGMLAISFSRVEEVLPFVVKERNALGISVADGQSGEIHRAQRSEPARGRRSWWKLWQ